MVNKEFYGRDLKFSILESKLQSRIGIEVLTPDILKTLNLLNKDGNFNRAGEILADENALNYTGIDIIRFGKNINQILDRETFTNKSVLWQYDKTLEMFRRYYRYEEIRGSYREKVYLIPEEAFREALVNAIVHRVWDINSHIQISMYEDRVELSSPGALPAGVSKENYLAGNISLSRNPIIAGVFFRLGLIEQFGTGVGRIIGEYKDSLTKPDFKLTDNNMRLALPLIEENQSYLLEDEAVVYRLLKTDDELTRGEIEESSGYNKPKVIRTLNKLIDKRVVKKLGQGPGTRYTLR